MKIRSTLRSLIIFTVISLFGCAQQPQRITQNINPEIVIKGVELEAVRTRIIDKLVSGGMRVDSESAYRIVVSKEIEGFRESLLRMRLGNSYSTPVRAEVAFTILKVKEGVKVLTQQSAWTQMPGGQINRMDLNGNKDFNNIQNALFKLRDSF